MVLAFFRLERAMTESPHPEMVLTVSRHVWVVFLHYADNGVSVKEMYRFRQIRRAGSVHDGRINALLPIAPSSVMALQVVCAFSEP